jgi:hypothetical protein
MTCSLNRCRVGIRDNPPGARRRTLVLLIDVANEQRWASSSSRWISSKSAHWAPHAREQAIGALRRAMPVYILPCESSTYPRSVASSPGVCGVGASDRGSCDRDSRPRRRISSCRRVSWDTRRMLHPRRSIPGSSEGHRDRPRLAPSRARARAHLRASCGKRTGCAPAGPFPPKATARW